MFLSHPRSPKRRQRFEIKLRITARGHQGGKELCVKGPKVSGLIAERIIVVSRRRLVRPRSWFSLGINEDVIEWLRPPVVH
jgi:hypothetical protein